MLKKYNELLQLNKTSARELFERVEYPWEIMPLINKFILDYGKTLGKEYKFKDNIWIHNTALISDTAKIIGPCIIEENVDIRHNAFIRENVFIGKNSVIGNSTELKNSILFEEVKCPHFNYVGDSILGCNSHLGAGVILSNVKNDKKEILIKEIPSIKTNLKKLGAIIGDNVEIGCNSVVFPGTIIYPNTCVYPLTRVRGVIEKNKIVKNENEIIDLF